MSAETSSPESPWRTIDQLARQVGAYCWLEYRLFELTGRWASEDGPPAIRVFFSEASARHADVAIRWECRLPVRAGIDRAALIAPPTDPATDVVALLEHEPDALLRLGGLVNVLLPRLDSVYRAHLAIASPVREAPVIEVLRAVACTGPGEVEQGRELLAASLGKLGPQESPQTGKLSDFNDLLQRSLEGPSDKVPGDWAS